ncbi:MAG: helix-turn-helix domain-containing protein, partial [Methylocystis sp.]|nr:helix-turn-helix domain-containing protein [Methylocystis sp.]
MLSETLAVQLPSSADDYAKVAEAIAFIQGHWRSQPSVEAVAHQVGLSASHLHALFRRWAGLTPKSFIQALTPDYARALLREQASDLDVALEAGLSGPGRLHDLFVAHEAMTPGEFESGGAGLALRYGFHPSPFGGAILVAAERGLAGLGFVDRGERAEALADLASRWPYAQLRPDRQATAPYACRVFDPGQWAP